MDPIRASKEASAPSRSGGEARAGWGMRPARRRLPPQRLVLYHNEAWTSTRCKTWTFPTFAASGLGASAELVLGLERARPSAGRARAAEPCRAQTCEFYSERAATGPPSRRSRGRRKAHHWGGPTGSVPEAAPEPRSRKQDVIRISRGAWKPQVLSESARCTRMNFLLFLAAKAANLFLRQDGKVFRRRKPTVRHELLDPAPRIRKKPFRVIPIPFSRRIPRLIQAQKS